MNSSEIRRLIKNAVKTNSNIGNCVSCVTPTPMGFSGFGHANSGGMVGALILGGFLTFCAIKFVQASNS